MEIATVDLTSEQLKYLRTLVLTDLLQNQRAVRSRAFTHYGPEESKRIHNDITIASALVAILPSPYAPDETSILPARLARLAAI